ncbi:MAG: 1-acyl-sn-glycerol-3-phosphate acyltransferase [Lachnospiraceae bacterium]|nr:1-acyl-sn-glycerol-3-phosphate acyltransferase [Lachnospiraceae bacterium]
MLRFYFVITVSIFQILYLIFMSHYIDRHSEKYTEESRYRLALWASGVIERNSRIKTEGYGMENLPKEGGYMLYPNHQGRYDAVGIMLTHEKPVSVVVDKERAKIVLLNEFISLVQGKRLDKHDIRSQVQLITEISKEVSEGRRYILFPEGGYDDKQSNAVDAFLPGSFKAAIRAKCPIVPVALIDSYRLFTRNSLKKLTTQVHYLKPLYYEDYKDLSTKEIAGLVRSTIISKISEVTSEDPCTLTL